MSRSGFTSSLLLDLVGWFCVPAAFLYLYVLQSNASSDSALPHLRVVFVAWCSVALLRLIVARVVPDRFAARLLCTAVTSAAIATMLFYYAVVLLGLRAWGRVISWPLIRSYALQAQEFLAAIGLHIAGVAAVLLAGYAAVFAAVWLQTRRTNWVVAASRTVQPWLFTLGAVAAAIGCAAEVYRFAAFPPVDRMEPLSLTFFPLIASRQLQNVVIDPMRDARLNAIEEAARTAYRPSPTADRKNVILIVVDALRPDRLGAYGYTRGTSPNLDRLAALPGARAVTQVRATCSASLCGLMSLLTSRYVHELPSRPFTLQQVLARHGYRTWMLLAGDHAGFYGLKDLFGHVDEYFDASLRPGQYMNADLMVVEKTAGLPRWDGTPVMIQFHLMSAHVLSQRLPEYARFVPAANYALPVNRGVPYADNFYDNGVVQADAIVDRLLQLLRAKGYLDDAIVVVTADHGESLGEGGRWVHARHVWDEAVRIPLLWVSPTARAWAAGTAASQVDVAPTILAELGMPVPATWSGVALQNPPARRYTYFQEGYAAGLIDSGDPARTWKYWVDTREGRDFAFDLTTDPRETLNAISTAPENLRREWRREFLRIQPGGTGVQAEPTQ